MQRASKHSKSWLCMMFACLALLSLDASARCIHTTTDARGKTTTYEYDDAGRQTQQILPNGQTIHSDYDENGNVKRGSWCPECAQLRKINNRKNIFCTIKRCLFASARARIHQKQ